MRRARESDLTALLALEREFPGDRLSRRSFRHLLARAKADVWVCEEKGALLGNAIVLYRRGTRTARLYSLVVAASARGRGIGQSLVAHAERHAAAAGCEVMHLEVRSDNPGALALYAGRGYAVVGRAHGYYEDGADALRLKKRLARALGSAASTKHGPRYSTGPNAGERRYAHSR
ncbi:acetyltransferase [Sulfurifustis variabilis]|uniref:Acetyltransferase n=1 Tax=Sulfurifustis variabilis TaxID=1675686 RepID=A0A1B4V0Y7_9GAMM|nr:N-acetyltransferase [Sulfurifustis variabilis]BAU47138.1 acetyltransferase [Sulfurifustis variabilis]